MRRIIRLEDKNGTGIFRSKIFDQYNEEIYPVLRRHNSFNRPQEDPGILDDFESGIHYCAYKSIDQLQQWIYKHEIQWLISNGIKVLLITVSECLEGKDQICFDKYHIITTEDISELFI